MKFSYYVRASFNLLHWFLSDQEAIIKHCPVLVGEMMNLLTQLWQLSRFYKNEKALKKRFTEPSLETFENVMRLSQMLVQAKWGNVPALLQLPHLTQEHLRHFLTKRVRERERERERPRGRGGAIGERTLLLLTFPCWSKPIFVSEENWDY